MIKDRLTEAVEANYEKILKGDDHIPIGIRGELEVIVKDRDGNIKSYERDHNQVTKLAKMALLHLLAGEIGTADVTDVYSVKSTSDDSFLRKYALSSEAPSGAAKKIVQGFDPNNHDSSKNADGQLVSGYGYFYEGTTAVANELSQVESKDLNNNKIKFNFPTKMLFGTGLEAHDTDSIIGLYADDFGARLDASAILALNGYASNSAAIPATFLNGCSSAENVTSYTPDLGKRLSNWYSADAYRCRTLQPASTSSVKSTLNSEVTAISGAIKNCFIETSEDYGLYNPTTKMAQAPYRGFGYPCFIYAKRSTPNFYKNTDGNKEVHYGINNSLSGAVPYETEVTYTVVMPAQPVASDSITTFYPYNGWVLRQAGLFCDSRYVLRSAAEDSGLTEADFLSQVNTDETSSNNAHTYRDNVGGQLLFARNLSSPILKTVDDEVTFIWHIFITV